MNLTTEIVRDFLSNDILVATGKFRGKRDTKKFWYNPVTMTFKITESDVIVTDQEVATYPWTDLHAAVEHYENM